MLAAQYSTVVVQEASKSAAHELGFKDLKPEQLRVTEALVQGREQYNYGRILCYSCLPLIFNKLISTKVTKQLL